MISGDAEEFKQASLPIMKNAGTRGKMMIGGLINEATPSQVDNQNLQKMFDH